MKYSVEMVHSPPAIILRAHEDDWAPDERQVEIPAEEAGRHADLQTLDRYWHEVEFEPHRLSISYRQLKSFLDPEELVGHQQM